MSMSITRNNQGEKLDSNPRKNNCDMNASVVTMHITAPYQPVSEHGQLVDSGDNSGKSWGSLSWPTVLVKGRAEWREDAEVTRLLSPRLSLRCV